ncbi:epsin-1-like [Scyliorhinus torazame]|uniref:epsin-1-like n=1 Tax=Scyliorhinus torazame TaxID=75743 RepID=UPI003B5B68B2
MDLTDVFAATAPVASSDPWGTLPSGPPRAPSEPLALPPAATDPWGANRDDGDPRGAGPLERPLPAGPTTSEAWPGGSVATGMADSWDVLGPQPVIRIPLEPWAHVPPPGPPAVNSVDPWAPLAGTAPPAALPNFDAFGPPSPTSAGDDFSDFDALRAPPLVSEGGAGEPDLLAGEVPLLRHEGNTTPDLFDLSPMGGALLPETPGCKLTPPARKTPESFLGPNAALVDLDALVSKSAKASNPFLAAGGPTSAAATNPFGGPSPNQSMSLNQLRASPVMLTGAPRSLSPLPPPAAPSPPGVAGVSAGPLLPLPAGPLLVPVTAAGPAPHSAGGTNPFLL